MSIDQSRLNEVTITAAEFLMRSLPRQLNGMRRQERDGYCELVLENPFNPDEPMKISTANGEVTLEFGQAHSHYSDNDGSWNESEIVGEMIIKVVKLASGVEASYSAWAGDACLGGGWLRPGSDGRVEFEYFPSADRLKIVAWEPWNDQTLERSEAT